MSRQVRSRIAVGVLLSALVGFYAATFSYRSITDTRLNSLQTRALVERGRIDIAPYAASGSFIRPDLVGRQVVPRGEALYSIYGVGISVVAAPIYAPLLRLGASESLLEGAVGVLFVAGSVALMYRLLLSLAPVAIAVGASAVFAFGTTMWPVASMAFFPQGPVVFFECVGLTGLFSRRRWGPVVAGFGFGIASFIRPTAAIPLLIVGTCYLIHDRREAAMFALGASAPLIGLAMQNRLIWDSWLRGGYLEARIGFRAPWPETLFRLLFGWWRGIFTYSPALLLGIAGVVMAARRARGFVERRLVFLGLSAIVTILLTSKWTAWHGGLSQFGYRLLLEAVPFLVVLGAYAVTRVDRLRPIAVFLGTLSILTMTWGSASSPRAFDGKLFARNFLDTSLAQSWVAFIDRPAQGLGRLTAVAAMIGLMILLARWGNGGRPAFEEA